MIEVFEEHPWLCLGLLKTLFRGRKGDKWGTPFCTHTRLQSESKRICFWQLIQSYLSNLGCLVLCYVYVTRVFYGFYSSVKRVIRGLYKVIPGMLHWSNICYNICFWYFPRIFRYFMSNSVRWFLGPAMNFYAHKDSWAGQPYIQWSSYSFHLAPRWTCAPL